jgi:hypothetical protein
MIRHVMRREQHRVVARGAEVTVGSIHDARLWKRDAAFGMKGGDDELVMLGEVRARGAGVLRAGGRGQEQRRDENHRSPNAQEGVHLGPLCQKCKA